MIDCYLGIDTSNYTTSVCIVDERGSIVAESRRVLSVPSGERGLQQSAAVFQHVQHLPLLCEKIADVHRRIRGIAVSVAPRRLAGSYMPVFMSGYSTAKSMASLFQVPLLEVTHQEGHIAAGEGTVGEIAAEQFLVVHLSGGTTDVLRVRRDGARYDIETLGSSMDLHAGQFVDRIGVALGLPFPAGASLEKLAQAATEEDIAGLPVLVRGCAMSFAGPASAAERLIAAGATPATVARAVERTVAKAVEKALLNARDRVQVQHVLVVGGVAANQVIRDRLTHRLEHPAVGMKLLYATPSYSTDNAFGVALMGWKYWTS